LHETHENARLQTTVDCTWMETPLTALRFSCRIFFTDPSLSLLRVNLL